MQVEVDKYILIHTSNGPKVKIVKVMRNTKADGRHKMVCNFCGFSAYPECREWCSKGGDEINPRRKAMKSSH